MISIDEYGHGGTSGLRETITYWDQARMVLQVMDKLELMSAYVLGTSQGGFIATRMALLEPARVSGRIQYKFIERLLMEMEVIGFGTCIVRYFVVLGDILVWILGH